MTAGPLYWVPIGEAEGIGDGWDGPWYILKSDPTPLPRHIPSRYAEKWPDPRARAMEMLGDPRSVREVLECMATAGWSDEAKAFLAAVLGDDPRANEAYGGARVRDAWVWATLPGHMHPDLDASIEAARARFWGLIAEPPPSKRVWPLDLWLGWRDLDGVPYHPPAGWHSAWHPDPSERMFYERNRLREAGAAKHAEAVAAGAVGPDAPNAFDSALDPASTARVAIPSRARTRWIVEQALGAWLLDLHTWDVHDVLVCGLQANPEGSLLAMIHAAHPDGVFHGMDDTPPPPRLRLLGRETGPSRERAPSSVIKRLCREVFGHWPLTDPSMTVVVMAVALECVHQWRMGRLHDFVPARVADRVGQLRAVLLDAERVALGLPA